MSENEKDNNLNEKFDNLSNKLDNFESKDISKEDKDGNNIMEISDLPVEPDFTKYQNSFNDDKNSYNQHYQWNYEKYSKMDQFSKTKSKKNKGFVVFTSIIVCILLVLLTSFCGLNLSNWVNNLVLKQPESNINEDNIKLQISENEDSSSFPSVIPIISTSPATQIAKKMIPSVVSVIPYARVQSFYQTNTMEIGSASGIIINSNGYIVTNAHAVLNLPDIVLVDVVKVILSNDKEYEAKIIGVDLNTDLAVIKVDANNLPVADFGDSNKLEVGEQVYAIGSPNGLEFAGSITSGIISALNRVTDKSLSLGYDNKYIQTDAAINPGNSGGALVNSYGQVIGINTRKLTGIDIEGIGLAIPITQAKPIIDDLINYGCVKGRVKLGIKISKEIDDFISRLNNVKTGLLIGSVDSASDLVNKDIRQYDILHEINNVKVSSIQELKEQLRNYKPNDVVHIVFFRYDSFGNNEQKIEVDVRLVEDNGLVNHK